MAEAPAPPDQLPWRKSRYGFALFWALSFVVFWSVLRLIFLVAFKPSPLRVGEAVLAVLGGLQRDLFAAVALTLPLLLWFVVLREKAFAAKWHRVLFRVATPVFCFLQVFLVFIEYYFFEEFNSRFNTVAVDYLIYPQEVFVNIWQSYPLVTILSVCLIITVAWTVIALRLFRHMFERPFPLKSRLLHVVGAMVCLLVLGLTVRFKGPQISEQRALNQIADNGAISFVAAAWTRHLDYSAFYKTIDKGEAYARARRLLGETNTQWLDDGMSIRRRIPGDTSRPRLNVVIILEESLGSKFWGCLGATNSLTPQMDALAASEGMLFANLYASGNRTVRGLEGVLSSFPPLPGDSIVKRDLSDNVETIARVLKRDGYSTVFLYGGRGLFDGMRSFAVRNGYDRFIEQKHFKNPTFTTIWGVCDEDLFSRGIEECRELAETGKPFLATMLTVSNHKPYTYPKGRIPEDPEKRSRAHAVKYSDYSLGELFRKARQESFWTNTVFVVVADHGDRVYGRQTIPIQSYEIPLLIAGPAVVMEPGRINQLGCSLDVSPTILGLLGRPYDSTFMGRDLLKDAPARSRVLVNHNRDIGMLAGERLAVLGLMKSEEFYAGDPKRVQIQRISTISDADRELQADAIALFQVADDLYMHQRYNLGSPKGQ